MSKHLFTIFASLSVFCGCGTTDIDITYYDQKFDETLVVGVSTDSALVLLESQYDPRAPETAFARIAQSDSLVDSLRITLHIVGETLDREVEAVVEAHWSADTLFIWCSRYEYEDPWVKEPWHRTSPIPPYLAAEGLDITGPPGVGVRYIGQRSY